MRTQPTDTDPEVERVQIRVLRAMPVWRRLAQVDALNALTDALGLADLRRRHPDATEGQLRQALLARRYLTVEPPVTTRIDSPCPDGAS